MADTIRDLLATHDPAAPAILAPDRPTLTFGALRELADATVATLNRHGIGRDDRVAIVLPNGPEMAAAFIAIAQGATTAPLNSAYREDELEFYLGDLRAKALVVAADDDGPAVQVARRHGTPVLRLHVPADAAAGAFELQGEDAAAGGEPASGPAGPDDVALVLHTSGTTSRPKIVPLLQRNLVASARHIGATLALTFAMAHDKPGEEVAAAVVLREGAIADEREIRSFAATRLADFKVPRKAVILPEIPKGATGKMQRIGLAQKLGLSA